MPTKAEEDEMAVDLAEIEELEQLEQTIIQASLATKLEMARIENEELMELNGALAAKALILEKELGFALITIDRLKKEAREYPCGTD